MASREKGGCIIGLYHMGGFFAEVWCSLEKDRVVLVREFKEEAFLQPNLELINLGELKE